MIAEASLGFDGAGSRDTGQRLVPNALALPCPQVTPPGGMQILRHSQISMAVEVYSEVPSAKTRNALKRLGRKLDG